MGLKYEQIGIRIKKERNRLKISQAQFAELVDLSVQYISQIERGIKHMSLETIANIANKLNVSVDNLLYGVSGSDSGRDIFTRDILSDCSNHERQIIYEALLAIKSVLIKNR